MTRTAFSIVVIAMALRALGAGEARDSLAARGFEPVGSTPEEYASHLKDEWKRVGQVVKVANIRLE